MFIAKRVVLDEQPTVLAVLPAHAPLNGDGTPRASASCRWLRSLSTSSGWKTSSRKDGALTASIVRPVKSSVDDSRSRRSRQGPARRWFGNGVDHATKLLFVSPELIFSPLQIVDIRVRAVPVDHLAELIALRLDADDEPAVFAVEAPQTHSISPGFPEGGLRVSICPSPPPHPGDG